MMMMQSKLILTSISLIFKVVAEIVFKCIEQYEQGSVVFCAYGRRVEPMQTSEALLSETICFLTFPLGDNRTSVL